VRSNFEAVLVTAEKSGTVCGLIVREPQQLRIFCRKFRVPCNDPYKVGIRREGLALLPVSCRIFCARAILCPELAKRFFAAVLSPYTASFSAVPPAYIFARYFPSVQLAAYPDGRLT